MEFEILLSFTLQLQLIFLWVSDFIFRFQLLTVSWSTESLTSQRASFPTQLFQLLLIILFYLYI